MIEHQFLKFNYSNDAARYCAMHNYEDEWELTDGMKIGDDYPSDVEFRMDDDFPDSIGRNDFLHTISQDVVIQPRVRDFWLSKDIPNLQFLDVVVKNHRGRLVPETFILVNFVAHVDCINQKETQFEWNSLDEDKMTDVSRLTLNHDALEGILLGRVKHLPRLIVIAPFLATEMLEAGFTGFEAHELSEFKP